MNIGLQIKHLRTKRGITQEALAQELSVSPQTVSKWETGVTAPDIAILPQIAIFFGVAIDDLFALNPSNRLERLQNKICSASVLDYATFTAVENELSEIAQNSEYSAQAEALLGELYLYQSQGLAEIAATHAKNSLAVNPDNPEAISTLANAMYSYMPDWNVRNHHELIAYLQNFLKQNPNNRAACMWLLDNLIDDNRIAEAEHVLEGFCQTDNTFRPLLYKRILAAKRGDTQAEAQLLQQLQAQDDDWLVSLSLGDIFVEKQLYEEAKTYYRNAIELQPAPRYTDAPESLAHICEIMGDKAGAEQAYRTALKILLEQGIVSGDAVTYYQRKIAELE